jgi:hypothetical protein
MANRRKHRNMQEMSKMRPAQPRSFYPRATAFSGSIARKYAISEGVAGYSADDMAMTIPVDLTDDSKSSKN